MVSVLFSMSPVVVDDMKLKLISLFTTVGLGLILLIPLVSASDTIYYEDDFDDQDNGVLSDNVNWVYTQNLHGNPTFALQERRETSGTSYESMNLNLPASGYEFYFEFLVHGITVTEYTLFGVTNSANGITCAGEVSVINSGSGPVLYVNNKNTGYELENDTWYSFWGNVTDRQWMDWSFNGNDVVYDDRVQTPGYYQYVNMGALLSYAGSAYCA